MKQRFLTILLFVGVAAYIFYLHHSSGVELRVGEAAPSFKLPSKEGPVSLNSFQGQIVLLNFWASWCPACVEEMPSLDRLNTLMQGKPFSLLAVSVDDHWKDIDHFLQRTPIRLKILLDLHGDVASAYGTNQLPETYLIDKKGIILKKYVGPRQWDEPSLVQEIQEVIKNENAQ